ncbi:phosphotransferase enzyme family protein [Streptomyces asiaticus]
MATNSSLPAEPLTDDIPLSLWGRNDLRVLPWDRDPVDLGFHSYTYLIGSDSDMYVAKCVPAAQGPKFTSGLKVALVVEDHGIPAGAPLQTVKGEVTAYHGEWCWALLRHLDGGRADENDPVHMRRAGETLGAVHTALADTLPPPDILRWDHLDGMMSAQAPFLDDKPWIQQAMREAHETVSGKVTMGLLHSDASMNTFRVKPDSMGLFDWGEVMYGPFLFDVATALSYLDKSVDVGPLLQGYMAKSPVPRSELPLIGTLLKFRAAAEAWIYARREWVGNDIGNIGDLSNANLLDRARKNLASAEEDGKRFLSQHE